MPSRLAISLGPKPSAANRLTSPGSMVALRPWYTPASLALAMPSSCLSFRKLVQASGGKLGPLALRCNVLGPSKAKLFGP